MFAHAPRVSDLVTGLDTTILLMRTKWRTLKSFKSKIAIWIGISAIFGGVIAASNSGLLVKSVAQDGGDTAAQQLAMTYLASFMRGELGAIGAGVLGLSVLSAIVAPFTGAVVTSLISQRDLVSFAPTRWHRFTDSLIGQVSSSISILQLIALSAITSMLTLQGGRGLAILFTWSVWGLLVLLSTLTSWVSEALYRKFGLVARIAIITTVVLIVGVAILLDPENGATLFGLGSQYAHLVQHLGVDNSASMISITFGVVFAVGITLFMLAAMTASVSLTLPEYGVVKAKRKEELKKKNVISIPPTEYPMFELFKTLFFSFMRSKESRKPLLAASILGGTIIAFAGGDQTLSTAFIVMVPLVIALAWGTNVFGILGGGMTWLASKPRIMEHLPWFMFISQIIFTLALFVVIWLPAIILGRVDYGFMPSIALAAISATILVARSAVAKSTFNPQPTHFGNRGETVLPPATTLSYTFRFALWQGQYGVILLSLENLATQVALAFAAIVWSVYRMTRISDKWALPETRKRVIDVVAQD